MLRSLSSVSLLPVAAALALAAATPAFAVLPPSNTPVGAEPVRVRTTDPAMQALLHTDPAWQDFVAHEGDGWQARFDQVTRTPHRMWGPGIDLGTLGSEAQVAEAVLRFLDAHASLLGLDGSDLAVRSASYVASTDAWYVDVDTLVDGLPIWRGGVTLRIKHDKLVMVGADTYPGVPVVSQPVLSAAQGITAALAKGPAPLAEHTKVDAALVLLPVVTAGKPSLHTVWEVTSSTQTPRGDWHVFVDAASGEVLAFYNRIAFLDGTLIGQHDVRLGNGTVTTDPLAGVRLAGGSSTVFTSDTGTFTLPAAATYTVNLSGQRIQVSDFLGTLTPSVTAGVTTTVTGADFNNRLAALTTYYWLDHAMAWGRVYANEVSWTRTGVRATVNENDVCNAFYDGTLNFFNAGSGCNNTGRQADVVMHEWGHGLHDYSITSGFFDGSLSEGAADFVAALQSGDSRLSPYFYTGGGTLRNANNNNRWPDDYTNNQLYVHDNGLIFSGAMWDTWQALRRDLGDVAAFDVVSELFVNMLKGGPDIEGSYDEAVFADDDDGNLGNGTPHLCQIIEGFSGHGLGPAQTSTLATDHTALINVPAGQRPTVSMSVVSGSSACGGDATATSAFVNWRRVGDPIWRTASMSISGGVASYDLPAFSTGDIIEYYAELGTDTGDLVLEPSGGFIHPHTYVVGHMLPVGCTTFEASDMGLTHALLSGTSGSGADDWQWGTPIGLSGDPLGAYSGTKAWGNDMGGTIGGTTFNGAYQDSKHNRLTTPSIPIRHFRDVIVAYRRWLTIEDGTYDQASVLADGATIWTNHASTAGDEHHLDTAWALHAVKVGSAAEADGRVTLAFDLQSDGGVNFGGWNVDDICLLAPDTPNNRLGIDDLRVTTAGPGYAWSFTTPKYGPVRDVVLVRTVGRLPTGHTDGTTVFRQTNPGRSTPYSGSDTPPAGGGTVYYAAYASDGTDWFSLTLTGLNAVAAP
ncbi:MAG: hypothetical protein H6733_13180 [Alphaproteobacteria bacterium]|nr:hypothetical protein [Alphaproteobacteria bacterium]